MEKALRWYKKGFCAHFMAPISWRVAKPTLKSKEYGNICIRPWIARERRLISIFPRKMGLEEEPLGKKLTFWGQSGEVIGLVKDLHFRPMQFQIEPLILRYQPQEFYFNLLVKTKPGDIATTRTATEKIYKKYEQEYPIEYGFVDKALDELYQAERHTGKIVLYFACLAIFISCIGLFGLASFTIVQRTKEMGIRKVFGASVSQLLFYYPKII